MNEKYSKGLYIIFPAVAMLLGWGLRGHIGGGPFGAMIPGAMVALSICMLLKLPNLHTAIIVVFGVAGIGLGGEMTYGQTLSFLRTPDTVWWGILATTVKGAVWGVLGAAVLSIGFLYYRLKKSTIISALLIMMVGLWAGFKLINEPMLVYFSNPEKPRPESWGALLLGAVFMLIYLKYKIAKEDFKIVQRFAAFGLIGGGLGFGLGGLWFVLGSALPKEVIFKSWWKAMEFSFGFLLGGALGYAAWVSRKELKGMEKEDDKDSSSMSPIMQLGLTAVFGLLIYWIVPLAIEPFVDAASSNDGFFMSALRAIGQIIMNYAFYGFILVLGIIYVPKLAWQLGITLTFCHAAIDLVRDNFKELQEGSPLMAALLVIVLTAIVAVLVIYAQRKVEIKKSIFLILVWSTMAISYAAFIITDSWKVPGASIIEVIFRHYFVDLIFTFSAIYVSWVTIKKIDVAD